MKKQNDPGNIVKGLLNYDSRIIGIQHITFAHTVNTVEGSVFL